MQRKTEYPIMPLILNRWSRRAMSGEPISKDELFSLFEAARWAPSSYNNQPWIFIYGMQKTKAWDTLFHLLVPFNQSWANKSSALILIASYKNFYFNGKPSLTHAFDTGGASMSLALEAEARGLVAHAMQGFDYEKAQKELKIPHDYEVLAMLAIGKRAPKETLPKELEEKEIPSGRKPLFSFVMEGEFHKKSELA